MKKRGPGRPPLREADRRSAIFSIRLSRSERTRIESFARVASVASSDWARTVLLRAAGIVTTASEGG